MLNQFRDKLILFLLMLMLSKTLSEIKNQSSILLQRRIKRDILIVDGTSLAIKWLITFPLRGVTAIATVLQITHFIGVPLMRIYPENRPLRPLNFTTLESFLKNTDLSQYFNQLRRYSTLESDDVILEDSEGRSYQPFQSTYEDFETIKNFYYMGNMTEKQKQYLMQYLSDLDAMRREKTRKKLEKSIIYKDFITLFEKFGFPGRECLLHTICEIAYSPFEDSLVGEMFNLIMTPSSGGDPKLLPFDSYYNDFIEAEMEGKQNGACDEKYFQCKPSFFSIVEIFLESFSFS